MPATPAPKMPTRRRTATRRSHDIPTDEERSAASTPSPSPSTSRYHQITEDQQIPPLPSPRKNVGELPTFSSITRLPTSFADNAKTLADKPKTRIPSLREQQILPWYNNNPEDYPMPTITMIPGPGELNGLGEDCVISIWRAKCPSVASPTRIRTVPVVGVPHHLEVELNGLGEDCVISIWRAKCPSVASPTRIRTVPVVGVPHHLEVELNGLGEDCVISIWRAKCPSVASPTRIRTVPVVGVPHHLEVELNGLGEDCVMSIWRAKCPSVANPTRIRTVPVVGVPHHLEVE
ncbi:hypothetical protein ACJJTC_017249 [Scirpophaga incertulas]